MSNSAIYYKSHKVLANMFKRAWHPFLIEVFIWLTIRYSKITITSAARDSGIHGTDPLRAFDLRSREFVDPQRIADDINAHFIYDPTRPNLKVCLYHTVGEGWHFHIQVHDNTTYRVT